MALPTAMGGSLTTNPMSLGFVTVSSAGTAVKITSNYTDLDSRTAHWISFQANPANGGVLYILAVNGTPPWTLPGGGSTSGADTSHGMNCIKWLQPGEEWVVPSFMLNSVRLGQFYVDAASSGDGFLVSFGEA